MTPGLFDVFVMALLVGAWIFVVAVAIHIADRIAVRRRDRRR